MSLKIHGLHQKTVLQALKDYFGYGSFRPGQEKIVQAVLNGRDVLAVLATGGGKSLCYQLPGLLLPGITFIISPLIALMQDQVDNLNRLGIHCATFLNSSLTKAEQEKRMQAIENGTYKLVYLAPERLRMADFKSWMTGLEVSLLAVDEAHCVSEWGHDFRTDYLLIHNARSLLPHVPVLALTATATPRVCGDIQQHVGLIEPLVHISSFDRPNLFFSVALAESRQMKYEAAVQFLLQQTGAGIVYVASRAEAEELARYLQNMLKDRQVRCYHAGMSAQARTSVQRQFIEGSVGLIIATNAFGMGIDKPDIRFVLHLHIPSSIEAYYQEAGRAGRDGKPAVCQAFYVEQDRGVHQYFIRKEFPEAQQVERFVHALIAEAALAGSTIDKSSLIRLSGISEEQLDLLFHLFERHGALLRCDETQAEMRVEMVSAPEQAIQPVMEDLSMLKNRRLVRFADMVRIFKTAGCRRHAVLSYFSATPPHSHCEQPSVWQQTALPLECCDNCRRLAGPAVPQVVEQIVQPVPAGLPCLPQTESEEAHQLGEQGSTDGIPRLLQLLTHPSVSVRRMACSALGKIASPEVVPQLLASTRDPNPQVRQYALKALGKINPEQIGLTHDRDYCGKFVLHLQKLALREKKEYNLREIKQLLNSWNFLHMP